MRSSYLWQFIFWYAKHIEYMGYREHTVGHTTVREHGVYLQFRTPWAEAPAAAQGLR